MESILTSIKKLLGIADEDANFDTEIMIHINSVFMVLHQIGVGPSGGFSIKDDSAIWSDFIEGTANIEAVKSYVYLKVKLLFDAESLSSTYVEVVKQQISEFEWRLNHAVDTVESANS